MSKDAFDLLGLSPRFDLPPGSLQSAYLALSAKLHPDAMGPDPQAEARSAALNEARRVLENPESRADLLLRRLGGPGKEQDRSLPQGFLLEMLEIREQIDAAIASGDPDAVGQWDDWAARRRTGHIAEVSRLFSRALPLASGGEATAATAADPLILSAIRAELNMWRYTERLMEQLRETT